VTDIRFDLANHQHHLAHDVHLSDVIDSPALIRKAQEVLEGLESARVDLQNQKGIWTSCQVGSRP
jgi:hypothetical protein